MICLRAIESTFRSLNNLLERLHASFFLYLMTSVTTFITVGNYLAAPVLISAGMTIHGLSLWGSFKTQSPRDSVSIARIYGIIGLTHAVGGILFIILTSVDPSLPIPVSASSRRSRVITDDNILPPDDVTLPVAGIHGFLPHSHFAPLLTFNTLPNASRSLLHSSQVIQPDFRGNGNRHHCNAQLWSRIVPCRASLPPTFSRSISSDDIRPTATAVYSTLGKSCSHMVGLELVE